jgi:hypothetical protein
MKGFRPVEKKPIEGVAHPSGFTGLLTAAGNAFHMGAPQQVRPHTSSVLVSPHIPEATKPQVVITPTNNTPQVAIASTSIISKQNTLAKRSAREMISSSTPKNMGQAKKLASQLRDGPPLIDKLGVGGRVPAEWTALKNALNGDFFNKIELAKEAKEKFIKKMPNNPSQTDITILNQMEHYIGEHEKHEKGKQNLNRFEDDIPDAILNPVDDFPNDNVTRHREQANELRKDIEQVNKAPATKAHEEHIKNLENKNTGLATQNAGLLSQLATARAETNAVTRNEGKMVADTQQLYNTNLAMKGSHYDSMLKQVEGRAQDNVTAASKLNLQQSSNHAMQFNEQQRHNTEMSAKLQGFFDKMSAAQKENYNSLSQEQKAHYTQMLADGVNHYSKMSEQQKTEFNKLTQHDLDNYKNMTAQQKEYYHAQVGNVVRHYGTQVEHLKNYHTILTGETKANQKALTTELQSNYNAQKTQLQSHQNAIVDELTSHNNALNQVKTNNFTDRIADQNKYHSQNIGQLQNHHTIELSAVEKQAKERSAFQKEALTSVLNAEVNSKNAVAAIAQKANDQVLGTANSANQFKLDTQEASNKQVAAASQRANDQVSNVTSSANQFKLDTQDNSNKQVLSATNSANQFKLDTMKDAHNEQVALLGQTNNTLLENTKAHAADTLGVNLDAAEYKLKENEAGRKREMGLQKAFHEGINANNLELANNVIGNVKQVAATEASLTKEANEFKLKNMKATGEAQVKNVMDLNKSFNQVVMDAAEHKVDQTVKTQDQMVDNMNTNNRTLTTNLIDNQKALTKELQETNKERVELIRDAATSSLSNLTTVADMQVANAVELNATKTSLTNAYLLHADKMHQEVLSDLRRDINTKNLSITSLEKEKTDLMKAKNDLEVKVKNYESGNDVKGNELSLVKAELEDKKKAILELEKTKEKLVAEHTKSMSEYSGEKLKYEIVKADFDKKTAALDKLEEDLRTKNAKISELEIKLKEEDLKETSKSLFRNSINKLKEERNKVQNEKETLQNNFDSLQLAYNSMKGFSEDVQRKFNKIEADSLTNDNVVRGVNQVLEAMETKGYAVDFESAKKAISRLPASVAGSTVDRLKRGLAVTIDLGEKKVSTRSILRDPRVIAALSTLGGGIITTGITTIAGIVAAIITAAQKNQEYELRQADKLKLEAQNASKDKEIEKLKDQVDKTEREKDKLKVSKQ